MSCAAPRRTILFLAGDLSGDGHSARVARLLARRDPTLVLHALGGRKLGEAALETGGTWIADTTNCSAISLTSVLKIYLWARGLQARMRKFVRSHPVDLVVLCDWGGFNCRQLKFFQKANLPVLYYFPPRSWQRTGTAGLQFAPYVTRVATPFDWSAARLAAVGCQADWVGHPLLENENASSPRTTLREEFRVPADARVIALLPGSRRSEIRVLAPRMAAAAALLAGKETVKFLVAVPEPLAHQARALFPDSFEILADRATDALRVCDAAVVKMGSATLEAAVLGAPQVTVYDVTWIARIEWVLLWAWKRIPFIAMPNIILQRKFLPELLGLQCRPETIAREVSRLLHDPAARRDVEEGYREIRHHLGAALPHGATEQTARIIEEMIGSPPAS